MLEESFGLLFYLRKPKDYSKGPLPIYLRITVDGVAKELSLNRKWDKNRWNPYASRPIGTKDDAKELTTYLDTIQVKVFQAKRQIMEAGEQITATSLMDIVSGKQQRGKMLLKIFREHNDKIKTLVGKGYALGTYKRFETALKLTKSFIRDKYNLEDVTIYSLNNEFVTDYAYWYKTVRNCSHNTTIKYITNLRKVILMCINNGWLTKDPFTKFSFKLENKDPVYLSKEEVQLLMNKKITNARLESVRDIFVFCCFTGLAFIDVKQLKRSEVCIGIDGQLWILKNRQKSAVPSRIPLLPISLQILEKYQDNKVCISKDVLLPVLTNQKYNAYLKEVADICNIRKNLTSHTARHTFATTITLANRAPIESVKEMLGHRQIRQTLHYARVLPIKLSEDMRELRERLDKSEFVDKKFK